MLNGLTELDLITSLMLIFALIFVLFYEAINGFHDTANAVAIVIYTRAMRLQVAIFLSGFFNFLGVILGGLSVAYTIVHLLPTDLLLNISTHHGLAMMFSMLLAAIIWNLGTWYFSLPASSSHTIIGAIIGVVITHALITGTSAVDELNIQKIIEIFMSLVLSPLIGLALSGIIVFLLRHYWSKTKKRRRIHMTPIEREKIDGKRKPPFWTRIGLGISAIGVSFSHGANDGQKGIGLLMLVLIGIAPAGFVVNMDATGYEIVRTYDAIAHLEQYYKNHQKTLLKIIRMDRHQSGSSRINSNDFHCDVSDRLLVVQHSKNILKNLQCYNALNINQRTEMRRSLMCIAENVGKVAEMHETDDQDKIFLHNLRKDILKTVEYAPIAVIFAIAIALSLGTMVGWRRVATTVGEKIGKKDMTYAQGISAQMTTAISIGVASYTGMPVSTTLVLSSAIAGSMIIDGGGVRGKTIKNIFLVWMITLPVAMMLSGAIYWITISLVVK
ncbi:inorganic phosphate transporter PitA [Candidatus Profftia tarda]|nr:inorganic phosphate transporter PitA [Candidatus Profftia tarda]